MEKELRARSGEKNCESVSQFVVVARARDNDIVSHFIFLIYFPERQVGKNKNSSFFLGHFMTKRYNM
jgi:hypothetical protein